MSQLLKTEEEWNKRGMVVIMGESSLHLDRYGRELWRADQVEEEWYDDNDYIEDDGDDDYWLDKDYE